MGQWIEIFRTGKHEDSAGNTKKWAEKDLDNIASTYNSSDHDAPVVIGHPKTNAPAYGWVKKTLKRDGDKLLAELKSVIPEFKDWVNKEFFPKRSIALYSDGNLRHLGFLGATPPAVKGLKDFKFAYSEGEEFQEWVFSSDEFACPSCGNEMGRYDKFCSQCGSTATGQAKYCPNCGSRNQNSSKYCPACGCLMDEMFGENENKGGMVMDIKQMEAELKEKEKLLQEFEEKEKQRQAEFEEANKKRLEAMETQIKEKEKILAEFAEKEKARLKEAEEWKAKYEAAEAEKRRNKDNEFCEKHLTKIKPANKEKVLSLLDGLNTLKEYEFAEGKKVDLKTTFMEFVESLPSIITTKEIATRKEVADTKKVESSEFSENINVNQEELQLFNEVTQYMKAHEGVSLDDAVEACRKEGDK